MSAADDVVTVELSDDEQRLLGEGLFHWGGPADCSTKMAHALGFDGVADLLAAGGRIRESIEAGETLSKRDWSRALLATEVAFASYVLGVAWDRPIVTGSATATMGPRPLGVRVHVRARADAEDRCRRA